MVPSLRYWAGRECIGAGFGAGAGAGAGLGLDWGPGLAAFLTRCAPSEVIHVDEDGSENRSTSVLVRGPGSAYVGTYRILASAPRTGPGGRKQPGYFLTSLSPSPSPHSIHRSICPSIPTKDHGECTYSPPWMGRRPPGIAWAWMSYPYLSTFLLPPAALFLCPSQDIKDRGVAPCLNLPSLPHHQEGLLTVSHTSYTS